MQRRWVNWLMVGSPGVADAGDGAGNERGKLDRDRANLPVHGRRGDRPAPGCRRGGVFQPRGHVFQCFLPQFRSRIRRDHVYAHRQRKYYRREARPSRAKSEGRVYPIPAMAVSFNFPELPKWRFGVGAYGISGLGVNYKGTSLDQQNFFGPAPLAAGTYSDLMIMKFAPTAAYQVN